MKKYIQKLSILKYAPLLLMLGANSVSAARWVGPRDRLPDYADMTEGTKLIAYMVIPNPQELVDQSRSAAAEELARLESSGTPEALGEIESLRTVYGFRSREPSDLTCPTFGEWKMLLDLWGRSCLGSEHSVTFRNKVTAASDIMLRVLTGCPLEAEARRGPLRIIKTALREIPRQARDKIWQSLFNHLTTLPDTDESFVHLNWDLAVMYVLNEVEGKRFIPDLDTICFLVRKVLSPCIAISDTATNIIITILNRIPDSDGRLMLWYSLTTYVTSEIPNASDIVRYAEFLTLCSDGIREDQSAATGEGQAAFVEIINTLRGYEGFRETDEVAASLMTAIQSLTEAPHEYI